MVQAKFSKGPRNACLDLLGLAGWLLRQPWDDGQWQLGGEVI